MTLDHILFYKCTDQSIKLFYFSGIYTHEEVFSKLGSCNDKSVYWLQNKKNMFFPVRTKEVYKVSF